MTHWFISQTITLSVISQNNHLSVWPSIDLCLFVSVLPSTRVFTRPSIRPSLYAISPFVYIAICLTNNPSVCLSPRHLFHQSPYTSSVHIFIRLSVRFQSDHISIHASFYVLVCPTIHLSVYPFIYLSTILIHHRSVSSSVHLPVHPSFYLPLHLSTPYPSFNPSIPLSVLPACHLSTSPCIWQKGWPRG